MKDPKINKQETIDLFPSELGQEFCRWMHGEGFIEADQQITSFELLSLFVVFLDHQFELKRKDPSEIKEDVYDAEKIKH